MRVELKVLKRGSMGNEVFEQRDSPQSLYVGAGFELQVTAVFYSDLNSGFCSSSSKQAEGNTMNLHALAA